MDNRRALDLPTEDDAHLYIWTTNSFVCEVCLSSNMGIRAKTMLTWVKSGIGMGRYYRNATEHVVFAVREDSQHFKELPYLLRRAGAALQPQAFYDMVEMMSPAHT
jgi:N6-adenosine-specific RNA methylase IME4